MEVREISLKDIDVLDNIRQKPIKDELGDLMSSIKRNGLMQPIGVREVEQDKYVLLWGYRRLIAYKKLGYNTIPAHIFLTEEDVLTEEDFLVLNATENIQRKTIGVTELGRVCKMLKDKGLSNSEIAVRLSLPRTRIDSTLDEYGRIPEKYKDRVFSFGNEERKNRGEKIPAHVISSVVQIKKTTKDEREKILDWAVKEEITLRELSLMKKLIENGMPYTKAIKELEKWKPIDLKLVFNKEMYDKLAEENRNDFHKFIKDTLNKKMEGLVF